MTIRNAGHPIPRIRSLALTMCIGILFVGCTTIRPEGRYGSIEHAGPVFSHDRFNAVLTRFVDPRGRVDYGALKEDSKGLDEYLHLIAAHSPDSHPGLFPTRNHRLAYWINAYNAYVMKSVITHYPIGSVLDVKTPALFFFLGDKAGFFFFQRFVFGGTATSLYYLENDVIRKRFNDPRIHFALNCASISCPRLPRWAFVGETLGEQLDTEARQFMAESRNVRIDRDTRTIWLSSIFKWYKDDFLAWIKENTPEIDIRLITYIRNYLPEDLALMDGAQPYAISFDIYDWGLNDRQ